MITRIYSVRDTAANAFLQPFFTATDGLAIRSFMDAVNGPDSQFSRHSADYSLYLLGDFDDSDGSFTPVPEPLRLMTGFDALIVKTA